MDLMFCPKVRFNIMDVTNSSLNKHSQGIWTRCMFLSSCVRRSQRQNYQAPGPMFGGTSFFLTNILSVLSKSTEPDPMFFSFCIRLSHQTKFVRELPCLALFLLFQQIFKNKKPVTMCKMSRLTACSKLAER